MTTDSKFEKLSALMDSELGEGDAISLYQEMSRDPALARQYHRMAVAREYLRGKRPVITDCDFLSKVQSAIHDEPVVLAPRAVRRHYREKIATFALAASMAVLAVLVGRSVGQYSPDRAGEMLAQVNLTSPVMKASMEPDLREYLTLHNESSYLSGSQGVLPSVRLVSVPVSR